MTRYFGLAFAIARHLVGKANLAKYNYMCAWKNYVTRTDAYNPIPRPRLVFFSEGLERKYTRLESLGRECNRQLTRPNFPVGTKMQSKPSLVPRPFLYGRGEKGEGSQGLVNNSTPMRIHGCIPAISVGEGKCECQVGVSRE